MPVAVTVCVPTDGTNESPMVCVPLLAARMAMPFVTPAPTVVATHDAPSIFADIERALLLLLLLVGPVVVLSLLLPHAVETSRTDIAKNRRRCIDRSF